MPKHQRVTIAAPPGARIVIEMPSVASATDRPLTACESDVIEMLTDGRVLTRSEILAELCAGSNAHGESTVEKALTRLVKIGRLTRSVTGSGYQIRT